MDRIVYVSQTPRANNAYGAAMMAAAARRAADRKAAAERREARRVRFLADSARNTPV